MATQKKYEKRVEKPRNSKVKSNSKTKTRKITPEMHLSEIQDLQLKVIGYTDQNNLDGKKLEKVLRQNHHLWRAVIMPSNQLYPLRDMENDEWSADTLYILAREGKESELERLANEHFEADEINWIGNNRALELLGYWKKDIADNPKFILSVWWD